MGIQGSSQRMAYQYKWTSPANGKAHFEKHGHEFKSTTWKREAPKTMDEYTALGNATIKGSSLTGEIKNTCQDCKTRKQACRECKDCNGRRKTLQTVKTVKKESKTKKIVNHAKKTVLASSGIMGFLSQCFLSVRRRTPTK